MRGWFLEWVCVAHLVLVVVLLDDELVFWDQVETF